MKKKLLAILLAICLLPVAVAAAEPGAVLSVTRLDGNVPGADIALTVTLAENPGLSRLDLKLVYDEERLEPIAGEEKTSLTALETDRDVDAFTDWDLDGQEASFDGKKDIAFNGDILTAAFRIKDNAPLGSASVTLEASGNQLDGTAVKFRVVSGGVKVLKPGSHVHDWGEGQITKEPTCTIKGVRSYRCPECKATRTEEIPALGHNWGPWELTKNPTATVPGIETRTCQNPGCKETESREITGQTVTLTLDPAGGEVVPETRSVIKDVPIGLLPTPKREGHAFLGWYSDPDTGSPVDGDSSFSTDATLWARWEEAEDTVPTLEAGTAVAAPGQKISVAVRLKGNPGIAGLTFAFDYDEDVLTYDGFTDSGLEGWMVGEQAVWMDRENHTENGEILLLTFQVNEEAEECSTDINFRDVYAVNEDLDTVELLLLNGKVEVRDLIPGDVNDDGKVDLLDLISLLRYTANDSVKINKSHADLNGDGKLDISDVLALQAQLANAE